MAGFLYFIVGVTESDLNQNGKLNRELLKEKRLDEVLSDVEAVPAHVSVAEVKKAVGPGGNVGCVLALVSKHYGVPDCVIYNGDTQQWFERSPGVWIGVQKGEPITSMGLERWSLIPGYKVKDPQTQLWSIPICRTPRSGEESGSLPKVFTFDSSLEPISRVAATHAWLWELSGQIREHYILLNNPPDSESTPEEVASYVPPDDKQLVKNAAQLLRVNYRLGYEEISILSQLGHDILTSVTVHSICQACFDFEVLINAKKKSLESDTQTAMS